MSSLLVQSLRRLLNLLLGPSPLQSTRRYWNGKIEDSLEGLYPPPKRVLPALSRGLARPMCCVLMLTRSFADLKKYHATRNHGGRDAEQAIHC